ncbi:MAG: hypothetical protein U5L04_02510 [Trueperaceae bacterium]|nr:hypothetical protein [Trueperaceae bacterium]
MRSRGEEFDERAAIAEHHGGLSPADAEKVAWQAIKDATREEAPSTWDWANKRWRIAVCQVYGSENMQKAHDALKQQHGADSFNDLTVEQLEESTKKIRAQA